nr:Fic family protein [Leptospira santarosai]
MIKVAQSNLSKKLDKIFIYFDDIFVMAQQYSHPFISFQKRWSISDDAWFKLGQSSSLIKAISSTPLMPTYRSRIYSVNLIKGALATTAIEGNTLSEEEIALVHSGKSLPISKQYMEIEVRNVLNALNDLHTKIVIECNTELLNPTLIKNFHRMIGKDLGVNFSATPGEFRKHNVTVGNVYRAPDSQEIESLIKLFCEWSKNEFHYEKGQTFSTAIIQAIVSHVYIAWIHPFGDGNGRTARLLEFYLLLRAGVPDIAAHILSNFYNSTRNEYYRQLAESSKGNGDLTNFINYALQGFKDGLQEVFNLVNQNQIEIAWKNYVNEVFRTSIHSGKADTVNKRRLSLILSMEIGIEYGIDRISEINDSLRVQYFGKSKRTLQRDIEALVEMKLILKKDSEIYKTNSEILTGTLPGSVKGRDII